MCQKLINNVLSSLVMSLSLTMFSVNAETKVITETTIQEIAAVEVAVAEVAAVEVAAVETAAVEIAAVEVTVAVKPTLVNVDESSFSCIREMTPVRHFYVDNLLGDIKSTLAAANAPEGAIYPAGSVVQLVPTEVMVKRDSGTFPATGDWEFFELEVNEAGSKIAKRGFVDVVNRFDGNCFACHVPARDPWDFICESGHGCDTIPIDHKMTGALQRSDPRCGDAVPEDGDWMALFKLKSMVTIGLTKKWFEEKF